MPRSFFFLLVNRAQPSFLSPRSEKIYRDAELLAPTTPEIVYIRFSRRESRSGRFPLSDVDVVPALFYNRVLIRSFFTVRK